MLSELRTVGTLQGRLAFGLGHVLSDLCGSMWLSYFLIYLHQVINFSSDMAGYAILLSQVVDSVLTLLISIEIDRTKGLCSYGKRKTWHLLGVLCVGVSLPFLFNPCITCGNPPDWTQLIYYAPFLVIFKFGLAATQISHLSLLTELTPDKQERMGLNSTRYALTTISTAAVFGIAWLLLNTGPVSYSLLRKDIPEFRTLSLIVVVIGGLCSLVFHIGVKERPASTTAEELKEQLRVRGQKNMTCKSWMKEPQFYLVGILYTCTGIIMNQTQIYMPMYLTHTLHLKTTFLAIIPLIEFVSGGSATLVIKQINKKLGQKFSYFIGLYICAISLVSIYFVESLYIILAVILLGIGKATILLTVLAIITDMIGENLESAGFVYGAITFGAKLFTGVAVNVIQLLHTQYIDQRNLQISHFYKYVITFVPGGALIVALICLGALVKQNIGKRKDIEESMKRTIILSGSNFRESEEEPLLNGSDSIQNYQDNCDTDFMNRTPSEPQICYISSIASLTAEQIRTTTRSMQIRHSQPEVLTKTV